MFSRFARLALLLFPLLGTAQTLPSLAPTSSSPLVEQLLALDAAGRPLLEQGSPVLPIWSGSNGKLLALVALPREWNGSPFEPTPAYAGPSAWQLAGSTMGAAGIRWQLGQGTHLDAMLGQYVSSAPIPCITGECATSGRTWSRGATAASLALGWTSAEGGLDLSYGLSWLQSQNNGVTLGKLALGSALVPVLTLPNAQPYVIDGEGAMYARGRWQFSADTALDLAASYGKGHLSSIGSAVEPLGNGIDLDQLSLSLGLDAGSLRGAIVGRVLSSDDPALLGRRWTTLDLGVSWRTPWSGELSVGAQNLWSAPSASPRDAENQARTPYIQYRQDL